MDWEHLRHVLAVGQTGTLSAAARRLGVNQTTVARRVRAAEAALGGPLFHRVDGRLVPTEAGAAVLVRAARMEREAVAVATAVPESATAISGAVRITAVDALVTHVLVPRLGDLLARHPGLAPEAVGADHTLDLIRREADVALRLARPQGGALRVRKLAEVGFAVYGPAAGGAGGWLAYGPGMAHLPEARWLAGHMAGAAPVACLNSIAALAAAAGQGLGRAVLPVFVGDAGPALARQSRVVVRRELWLAVHEELSRVPRIRAVADWLTETLTALRGDLAGL